MPFASDNQVIFKAVCDFYGRIINVVGGSPEDGSTEGDGEVLLLPFAN